MALDMLPAPMNAIVWDVLTLELRQSGEKVNLDSKALNTTKGHLEPDNNSRLAVAGTKQGCADADDGGAFLDGHFQVAAHAHGKGVEPFGVRMRLAQVL